VSPWGLYNREQHSGADLPIGKNNGIKLMCTLAWSCLDGGHHACSYLLHANIHPSIPCVYLNSTPSNRVAAMVKACHGQSMPWSRHAMVKARLSVYCTQFAVKWAAARSPQGAPTFINVNSTFPLCLIPHLMAHTTKN